jgi:protein SCO1/2
MTMSWRLASRLSVVTLALLVVLVIAVFSLRNGLGSPVGTSPDTSQSGLQGTDLGSVPAPDFRLKDQFGKSVALSQFKGVPVVVTFLYTHCPDICPLVAEKLHSVVLSLGKDAQHVAILAVSMDPKGDTQAAALNFSNVHKMTANWHFLIGSLNQLSPIWESYSVDAQAATKAGVVEHSTFVYVIDKEGRERVLLDNDFTSAQLTSDLKVLMGE